MTAGNGDGQAGRYAEPTMSPRTRVAILTVRRALIMMANALGELVGQPPVRVDPGVRTSRTSLRALRAMPPHGTEFPTRDDV